MENYIGKLQEFYQKVNSPLPIYSDNGKNGDIFEMKVQLPDGRVFNGYAKNKKEAKINAAQQAWQYTATCKKPMQVSGKVYLAIDIENIGDYAQQLNQYNLVGELSVVGFYSESCVRGEFEDSCIPKILISSSRKDATDIGMIMYITQLYLQNKYDQIIIWTKDHYGIVVKEILDGNFGGCTTVKVIKSLSELAEN